MKKLVYSFLILFMCLAAKAQKEFPMEWKSAFPVSTEWRMINEDRTLALGGDLNELAMLETSTGKVLWKFTFKEKFGQKKAKDWDWEKNKGVVYITFKGDKKDQEVTYYIDEKTAETISTEKYNLIKVKSADNWTRKGTLVIGEGEHKTIVTLEYEKKKVVSSMGKGKKGPITVRANGENTWSTSIEAKYVRTLCANAIPMAAAEFGGDFLKLMYESEKVFVIYEGLSVLDIKTGKLLWQTDLDNVDFDFGVFKSTQTLGRAGYPLVTKDAVYVVSLSKGEQHRIKKFDLETGKLIWESEKFDEDDVVPDMQISGNILVAQFGGRLETQSYIPGTSGRPDVCKSEIKFVGDPGVKAYDATSGKVLWQTNKMKELGDKFSSAITNIITENNLAYVASDKNFYAFDVSTGKPKFTVPVSKLKIDKPRYIVKQNDQTILLQAEEGIASIQLADGKVNFATNTDKCLSMFYEGDAFFVWNGKSPDDYSSFVRIDLSDGKILGKMDDTSYPFFTPDGEAFIKFSGEKVMRYKTKP